MYSIFYYQLRLTLDYDFTTNVGNHNNDNNGLTDNMGLFSLLSWRNVHRIKIELHFSLIAAAVTYIMWKNVGNDKIQKVEGKRFLDDGMHSSDGGGSRGTLDPKKRRSGYWRVDCQSASKGLFLGLLCLVGGIIILIIFFVMKVINAFCLIQNKFVVMHIKLKVEPYNQSQNTFRTPRNSAMRCFGYLLELKLPF